MSVREISVKNVDNFAPVGFFPLIAKYVKGYVKESMLPIPVKLKDIDSGNVYDCQLKTLFGFDQVIPETFSYMLENKPSSELEPELLERFKVNSINQLGFYLYAFNR